MVFKPIDSASFKASSLGNAIPFTPDSKANRSVWTLCIPFGLMHPREMGVFGIVSLAAVRTFATSVGLGGFTFIKGVP